MFEDKVKKILNKSGWQGESKSGTLVEMWEGFVSECSKGYAYNIYEYENDLSVRNAIERILSSNELESYLEYFNFKNKILELDQLFKALLSDRYFIEDRKTWWEKGILIKGGVDYVNDIEELFKIKIQEV